jgi:hypothetical protein
MNGFIAEMGDGFWIKIEAKRVPLTKQRPHGIDYSLCLIGPHDDRRICYDNAHTIGVGNGPSKKQTVVCDHVHKGSKVRPYIYSDAGTLLEDFWKDVDEILAEEGVT